MEEDQAKTESLTNLSSLANIFNPQEINGVKGILEVAEQRLKAEKPQDKEDVVLTK